MGILNRGTQKEKLQAQQQKLGEQARELQVKEMKIKGAMEHVQVELEIDGSVGNKKRLDKLRGGLENCQKELEQVNSEAQKVAGELAQISLEEKAQQIEEASQEHSENYYRTRKRVLLEGELERISNSLWGKSNQAQPQALKQMAGIKYSESLTPEHSKLYEAQQEAEQKATEQADKEFNELMDKIKAFLEL